MDEAKDTSFAFAENFETEWGGWEMDGAVSRWRNQAVMWPEVWQAATGITLF